MENKSYLKYLAIPLFILIGLGIYFGYRYYSDYKKSLINPGDVQNQINYSDGTKKLLDRKPFIDKLPYTSASFDVYYSSIDDAVQIIMKAQGLTFEDAKKADEVNVDKFLQSIGVDPDNQKIVWLLQQ